MPGRISIKAARSGKGIPTVQVAPEPYRKDGTDGELAPLISPAFFLPNKKGGH